MYSYDAKEDREGAKKSTGTNKYQEWIEKVQKHRNTNWKLNVATKAGDTPLPPSFNKVTP